MKNDPRSCERDLCSCVRRLKKIPVRRSNKVSYEAQCFVTLNTMVYIQSAVCIFLLSTNLYIKDQQDMSILISFLKNITSSAGKPGINHTKRNAPFLTRP